MKKFLILVALIFMGGCATAPTVNIDSDPSADFSAYRTFKWLQPPQGPSPLQQKRIMDGVSRQLQEKGWTESDAPDIYVVAHVATRQQQDIDTFYSGPAYAGWGRRGWGAVGMASTTVRTYDTGTLIVDLFDARTKQAVWRGSASSTIPDAQNKVDERVQSGIAKMFAKFPPK